MSTTAFHTLKVLSVVAETPDAKSIIFDIPKELGSTFNYKAGQFLTLRVPNGEKFLPRCYSLASSPVTDSHPKVTVKRVRDGRASNWICDNLKPGDELEVLKPAGIFTPKQFGNDLLLWAGGSGVTPVFSILQTALRTTDVNVVLIYANRDQDSIIFKDKLNELSREFASRLTVIHWLDAVQGIPTVEQLAQIAKPFAQLTDARGIYESFICGPGPFMDSAVAALTALKVPSHLVHVERFVSLPEEGAIELPGLDSAEEVTSTLFVELDGQTHELQCSSQQTLLDAMLKADLFAPYSCKVGACATCMCTQVEGDIHLQHNEVLEEADLQKKWTLACQAYPRSDVVRVRFPD